MDPPSGFLFPFTPYDIQNDFMHDLFRVIEERKIGIFESPTGTGKSMSIICGSLTWLRAERDRLQKEITKIRDEEQTLVSIRRTDATTDWLSADYAHLKEKDELRIRRVAGEKILNRENDWKKRREHRVRLRKTKQKERDSVKDTLAEITAALTESQTGISPNDPDTDLLLDYRSDEENAPNAENLEEEEVQHVQKIYYASRTHSQITQFVNELKKSPFGKDTRLAVVASRQNLCVFEPVRNLRSLRLLNDRCLELQKGSKKKPKSEGKKRTKRNPDEESSCPYFARDAVDQLADEILEEAKDIEDLVKAGTHHMGCPYYASRNALPDAEVVAVPYNLLLHRSTREASGITVKDQVVIFDEAHNLVDAITGMYNSEISEIHTRKALSQLHQYLARYRTRLSAKNVLNIKQLLFLLDRVTAFWTKLSQDPPRSRVLNTDQFLIASGLESVGLRDVLKYCRKSMISRKLMSFGERYPGESSIDEKWSDTEKRKAIEISVFLKLSGANPASGLSNYTVITDFVTNDGADYTCASPLMIIEGFLETLTNAPEDGRIVLSKDKRGIQHAKFLLLNPAVYVKDIFADARAVIFAGGTMQPIADFEHQLLSLSGVCSSRIYKFSCSHIISPDNILPLVIPKGPAGGIFQFTYQNRENEDMILQLIRTIQNLCNVVPGGVVCFFPSYEYEEKVYRMMVRNTDTMKSIEKRKKIFREPKTSGEIENLLLQYSKSIAGPTEGRTGALMMAVVGGKLSEGINFSDDLGRCVIMVGLPYPNRNSTDLQEKMKFLDSKLAKNADGRLPSEAHYEGLCMKAVNQSIGRAIRHKNDYAAIVLMDSRYANDGIRRNLPGWIGQRVKVCTDFASAFGSVRQFFATKSIQQQQS